MGKFTKSVTKEIEFDDDKITVELRRLRVSAMQLLAPHISKVQGAEKGDIKMRFESTLELMNMAKEILPDHVTSMTGLIDAEGNALTLNDVFDEAYFLNFIMTLFKTLFDVSNLGDDTAKKSGNTVPPDLTAQVAPEILNSLG